MFSLFGENHPICLILLAFSCFGFLTWRRIFWQDTVQTFLHFFFMYLCTVFFFLWKFCNPLELCSKCWRKVGLHPNTFGLRRRICSVIHSFLFKKGSVPDVGPTHVMVRAGIKMEFRNYFLSRFPYQKVFAPDPLCRKCRRSFLVRTPARAIIQKKVSN